MPEIAEVIKTYVAIRDEIAARKKQFTQDTASLKESLSRLETYLQQELTSLGLDSLPTEHGVAFTSTKTSVRVEDRAALEKYIAETGEFNLLTLAANKLAVNEYISEHESPPPGVKFETFLAVSVRRPSATKRKAV